MTVNAIAGISGGRTSARMAFDLDPNVVLCFQNTGEEHEKTLRFLRRVEDDIGRPIVRLEFRAPPRGDEPSKASFEIVSHDKLSRRGQPFRDLLACLAAYRWKHKKLGPVAPWARRRVCTAYLKTRTQMRYARSLGWESWDTFVGFRFDEPDRVAKMRKRNDERDSREIAPLFDQHVVKSDVLAWWSRKPYDLDLDEHLGNCKACFLKDERDLADSLGDPSTGAQRWLDIERQFGPMRRGGRPSYEQVLADLPERLRIRAQLESGVDPSRVSSSLPSKRTKLVVRQELAPREGFSCGCGAEDLLDDEAVLDMAAE